MPFTPFHLGPGAATKALSGRHFSFMLFGFAQVAMDIEPLLRILRGDAVLHGFTHTYVGASLVAIAVFAVGRPCCQWALRLWNLSTKPKYLRWLQIEPVIPPSAAVSGAFIGTYSHVLLDSIMHADMQPWYPFSTDNGLLYAIPAGWLHIICLILGVVGGMTLLVIFIWNKIAIDV